MPATEHSTPTAFASYSWTSPEYAERVEQLARDLMAAGIHVILDQWDLAEGQDKYAFMERCVSDASVDKVLILIDPRYTARADRREGGVGTETLIISPEVYERTEGTKFIPVIMERDEDGRIQLPVYLKGRIFIDLSDPERYEDEFERLVRNLHGRPARERPALGARPAYLEEGAVELKTGRALPAFRQALLHEKRNQLGYLADYLDRVAGAYEAEKVPPQATLPELDLAVSESIDRWTLYRDEFVEMLHLLGRYGDRPELYDRLHTFFERLLNIREGDRERRWTDDMDRENLAFIGWELFLYAVAILLEAGQYEGVQRLLRPYHVKDWAGRARMQEFPEMGSPFRLLQEVRQKRLGSRRLTAAAHLLRERRADGVDWDAFSVADTLLWARTALAVPQGRTWYPLTAAFMEYEGPGTLSLWARVRSDAAAFSRLAPLLGIRDREEAKARLANMPDGPQVRMGHVELGRAQLSYMAGSRDLTDSRRRPPRTLRTERGMLTCAAPAGAQVRDRRHGRAAALPEGRGAGHHPG